MTFTLYPDLKKKQGCSRKKNRIFSIRKEIYCRWQFIEVVDNIIRLALFIFPVALIGTEKYGFHPDHIAAVNITDK